MTKSTALWLHGLFAALIVGTASAIDSGLVLVVVAPDKFNVNEGLKRTLITILVLGILSGAKAAFAYLRQSPIPPESQ